MDKIELKRMLRESLERIINEEQYTKLEDFLDQAIGKMTFGSVYYVSSMNSSMNKYLVTPDGKIPNPMYDKIFKHTLYEFRWKDTHKRAAERLGKADYVPGERRGKYDKVEGYDVLESKGSNLYLPILPTKSKYNLLVMDGGELHDISREEVQKYLAQREPYKSSSGVAYRQLMISSIVKLTGGGNQWINPDFKGEWRGPKDI